MSRHTDVPITGAGHDGLACAFYPTATGLGVTMFETGAADGGLAEVFAAPKLGNAVRRLG